MGIGGLVSAIPKMIGIVKIAARMGMQEDAERGNNRFDAKTV